MHCLGLQLKKAYASHPAVRRRTACKHALGRRHLCHASQKLRPLLIDNYDSYTYNLYQIVAEVYGVAPLVLHNDAVDIAHVQQLLERDEVHHIILSPGPGSPDRPADIGVCMDILRTCTDTPLLGVCLGHQALAAAAGGAVIRAPEPVHGRLSPIRHTGHELFAGCPSGPGSGFDVVRYHSLVVDSSSLPLELEALAWSTGQHHPVALQQLKEQPHHHQQQQQQAHTAVSASTQQWERQVGQRQQAFLQQELIMALKHRQRPHYGVQFHPESIATQYGIQLLMNFRDIAYKHSGRHVPQQLVSNTLLQAAGPPGRAWPPRPWPSQQLHMQKQQLGVVHSSVSNAQQQALLQQEVLQAPAAHCCSSGVGPCGLELSWLKLSGVLSAAGGSVRLFEQLVGPGPDTFWLDSASAPERARFSYMGGENVSGPMACRVTYSLPQLHAAATAQADPLSTATGHQQDPAGVLTITITSSQPMHQQSSTLPQQKHRVSIWDYLQTQLQHLQLLPESASAAARELPFNFWGGFVGYFGYELKAECGGSNAHAATGPDAAWLFADRVIVCDHMTDDVYLLALHPAPAIQAAESTAAAAAAAAAARAADNAVVAKQWLADTVAEVHKLVSSTQQQWYAHGCGSRAAVVAAAAVHDAVISQQLCPQQLWLQQVSEPRQQKVRHQSARQQQQQQQDCSATLRHEQAAYLDNVMACQEALVAGESYELCLTTAYELQAAPDPWQYYQALRRTNPAPYAAWLNIGDASSNSSSRYHHTKTHDHLCAQRNIRGSSSSNSSSVIVCCSSPERFLQGGRGGVLEAKPIKGTAARHPEDPAADAAAAAALISSEKERAENLMIVDLLRNDLGKVCEPGSVHVPGLIQLESHAAVHQLVSTVRGLRRPEASCTDAVRAAFPGGSMTGAPKVRSMAILDGLEGAARGVYSGALGYLSINDTFDLNIVIRSAVFTPRSAEQADNITQTANPATGAISSSISSDDGYVMSVGAGGAVVVQSDPDAEFAEMQLKAKRLLETAMLVQQSQSEQRCQTH